jgi:Na+/proline symporter
MSSWVVICIQFTLFLMIGTCLFTLYSERHWTPPEVADRLYPLFIWEHLPVGIAGLVIAAILAAAMSNLSAALNSLASATVMDFWKPLSGAGISICGPDSSGRARSNDDARWLRLSRLVTVVWASVLFGVAMFARQRGSVLEAGLSIASVIYGSLLGVFLLGLLTRRVGEKAAMFGMCSGLALILFIKFETSIAWTWYVLIGTAGTFSGGLLASLLIKENPSGKTT